MKLRHWIGNVFWLVIGAYTAIKAYLLGLGNLRHPGAGFIFFVAALLLIILSLIDLAGTFIRKSEKDQGREEQSFMGRSPMGKSIIGHRHIISLYLLCLIFSAFSFPLFC